MHMITVFDVANYFLFLVDPDTEDCVTNLKLQKLCYYAQGLWLAKTRKRLFNDSLEAWAHGPVVGKLYHKYKKFGGTPLSVEQSFFDTYPEIDNEIKNFLNDIYANYGQYSAWKLRDMTHQETPWINASRRESGELTDHDMIKFFSNFI